MHCLHMLCFLEIAMAMATQHGCVTNAAGLDRRMFSGGCDDIVPVVGCFCQQSYGGRQDISCHDLGLTEMPVFSPNGQTLRIESIHLTGNTISTLNNDAFRFVSVRKLYMPNNELQDIGLHAFIYSSSTLVHLDLSHNKLTSVPIGLLNIDNLKTVIFTDNEIAGVDWVLFDSFHDVSVYLDQNPIDTFHNENTQWLSLQKLVIGLDSYDMMLQFDAKPMERFPMAVTNSLQFLLLRDTRLSSVGGLDHSKFPKLEYVGFEGDDLELSDVDKRSSFKSIKQQLRGISLADNELRGVPYTALRGLEALKLLNLSKNKISRVDTLPDLPSLKSVDLSGNKIIGIYSGALQLPSLQMVDISDNRLSILVADAIPVSQLVSLSIRGNPWSCSCSIKWLIELLQKDAREGEGPFSTAEMFRESDGARCVLTGGVPDVLLFEVNLDNYVCYETDQD